MGKNLSSIVSRNLELMRRTRNLSKRELADRAKISLRALNYYLTDERTPQLDTLKALAKALTLPVESMFDPDLLDHYTEVKAADVFRKRYLKASEHQKRVIEEVLKEELSTPPSISSFQE